MPPKGSKGNAGSLGGADASIGSGVGLTTETDTSLRQTAMVASTFANVELQTTKRTLKEYVQLFEDAREENQRLSSELVERDKDSMRVVQFLRAELDGKVAEIAAIHKQHKADIDRVRTDFHGERKKLLNEISERDEQMDGLKNQLSVVQGDLEALQTFAQDRDRLYAEMQAFREQRQRECEQYEAEISRLRFVSLEEKVRVKAEERMMSEKFEAEVNDRAMKLLDVKTREIHNENFALLQDKVLLEEELDRLVADHKSMKTLTMSQRRDVDLAKVADEEYAKRGARQSREIKDLRAQSKLLEQNIAKLIDEYEHKLEVQQNQMQAEIDKFKEERDLAIRNAEVRHKELVKMRQLTKTIVTQRSELEIFFNEALDHVRHQIVLERQALIQDRYRLEQPALKGLSSTKAITSRESVGRGGSDVASAPPSKTSQPPLLLAGGATGGKTVGSSGALVPAVSEHPFFQGARGFDSIYEAAEDPERTSHPPSASAHQGGYPNPLPRTASSGDGSGALLPAIYKVSGGGNYGRGPGSGSIALPPAGPSPPQQRGGALATSLNSTTDIAQLSWPDKERVLRILLAKINNTARFERKSLKSEPNDGLQVVAPVMPKQLLEHSSDTFLTQGM